MYMYDSMIKTIILYILTYLFLLWIELFDFFRNDNNAAGQPFGSCGQFAALRL